MLGVAFFALLSVIIPRGIMLSVNVLSVVMLSAKVLSVEFFVRLSVIVLSASYFISFVKE